VSADLDASSCDELPLWSAPFGLALLEAVKLSPGLTVLDVGFGTGFPVLELAQRLGPGARVYGVDPWREGAQRARAKAAAYGLVNVVLIRAVAESLPLASGRVDLVVSNNGFNNVQDLETALREAKRVCRPGAQLVLTLNLPDTMRLFYDEYAAVLRECGLASSLAALQAHIDAQRPSVDLVHAHLATAGFEVVGERQSAFSLRFLDGKSLFAHDLIRRGFLEPWRAVPPAEAAGEVLARLEQRLDAVATERGEVRLEVPFACLDCRA
jgi:ubiquinone/menaquinone biosynthesis C-methylase UbiE